ncbi:Protein ras-2 [Grifola frondosa]|uniref:Protein ras-2 n=1 Tax=Grifola frondosa TaxID=5627 RepID=A0A1C7MVE9_GRIFR|nr:Protein ras-2 [Grifola frondosa]
MALRLLGKYFRRRSECLIIPAEHLRSTSMRYVTYETTRIEYIAVSKTIVFLANVWFTQSKRFNKTYPALWLGSEIVDPSIPLLTETYDPTIEDAYRKQLVVDNRMCFVEVIDTAGQEEYATLRDQWVREGQGFILVYSIASRATFDRLDVFRQAMLKVKRQKPVFMLVGNKCDKQYEREVSRDEGAQLARAFGCEFLETSAKTAQNVERLFTNLVRLLRSTKQQEQGIQGPVRPPKEEKKRKCIIM